MDSKMLVAVLRSVIGESDQDQDLKSWFNGSKVVDKNNEPLIVYHGTTNNFKEFKKHKTSTDSGMWGEGFYFSSDKKYALTYTKGTGHLMSVYLSIKNPYEIKNKNDIPDIEVPEETMDDLEHADVNYSKAFTEYVQKKGHDGVIVYQSGDVKEYVVYEPSQIKIIPKRHPRSS